MVLFFAFAAIFLIIACDRTGKKGSVESRSVRVRIDTLLVRDTLVVVDTLFVEKEVVKKVEVPVEVPAHYVSAWETRVAKMRATYADEKTLFMQLNNLSVTVALDEEVGDIISEQRAKDKFELTLRRHGVPLAEPAVNYLLLDIDAFWNESNTIATWTISVGLLERFEFFRSGKPYWCFAQIWESRSFGTVGKNLARESLLREIEEKAERVANLYLSAN